MRMALARQSHKRTARFRIRTRPHVFHIGASVRGGGSDSDTAHVASKYRCVADVSGSCRSDVARIADISASVPEAGGRTGADGDPRHESARAALRCARKDAYEQKREG